MYIILQYVSHKELVINKCQNFFRAETCIYVAQVL